MLNHSDTNHKQLISMRRYYLLPLLFVCIASLAGDNVLPYWAIGGFVRPEGKNGSAEKTWGKEFPIRVGIP